MSAEGGNFRHRQRASQGLALLAAAAAAVALIAYCTGGFAIDTRPLAFSARSPGAPAATALLLTLLSWIISPRVDDRRAIGLWLGNVEASGPALTTLLAIAAVATGAIGGLKNAGSADATGYVAEARLISAGQWARIEPLGRDLRVAAAPHVVTPLGFRSVDAARPDRQVPTYPPGLPLLMALAAFASSSTGPFVIVPLLGGAAVWLVFWLGRTLGRPGAGLAAATVLATSPPFLFQLLQPMSDVPVTAFWLLAAVLTLRRQHAAAGLAAGLAVLVRPNLLPMVLPLLWYAAVAGDGRQSHGTWAPRAVLRWIAVFAVPMCLLAVLHTIWYGAPWRSGYGNAADLFATANVWPNLQRYGAWLMQTGGPLSVALGVALVKPLAARSVPRSTTALSLMAAINVLLYLPYYAFEEWHYLRFLLPGIALLLPSAISTIWSVVQSGLRRWAPLVVAAAVCLQSVWQLSVARDRDVFRLPLLERRYALTAAWLRAHTAPDDVVVCAQQSGSVVLNASRSIARWDVTPAGSLDNLVAAIEGTGRSAWLVVEAWEQPDFAARHGRSAFGSLDWPPAALINSAVRVQVFKLEDRDRFRAGGEVRTDYVAEPARR